MTRGEVNEAQRAAWDGPRGDHWAKYADAYDAQLAPYVAPLIDAAALTPTSRVLDIGCGCGAVTLAAARAAPDADTVGVDLSEAMLDLARRRAEAQGVRNARFRRADVQDKDLDGPFDAAISRFGVMFFDDPVAAFNNVASALVPGGRVAFVCWRSIEHNEWLQVPRDALATVVPLPPDQSPAAPGPSAFGDADRVREILGAAGFETPTFTELTDAVQIGGGLDADAAVDFVRGTSLIQHVLDDVDEDTERRALDALRAAIAPHAGPDGAPLGAAAWLVTTTRA